MADKYYKKHIEKLINSNPTTITIKRKKETDDGFGGTIITDKTITETVTFYDNKARREVITDYGKTYIGVSITKMLTRASADIIEGDKFKVDSKEYKVFHVDSYKGICKQVELEVIA